MNVIINIEKLKHTININTPSQCPLPATPMYLPRHCQQQFVVCPSRWFYWCLLLLSVPVCVVLT